VKQRSDFIATRILGDKRRARKVRAGFSTRGVAAVTKTTLRGKSGFASLDLLDRIGLRSQRLRRRERGRALSGRWSVTPGPICRALRYRNAGGN
jgi:hypothetical protein